MVQVQVVVARSHVPVGPPGLYRLNLVVEGIRYVAGIIEPRPARGATFELQDPRPGGPR